MDENNLLHWSRALLTQGEKDAASELLEALINHNPFSVEALRALAQTRMAQGRPHDAIGLLQKALALIKATGAAASDGVFDEQDAHYLQEQHTAQVMLREEGTFGLTGSDADVPPAERGGRLLPPISDRVVAGFDPAIVPDSEGLRAQSHTQKDPVTDCTPLRSLSTETVGHGPWPFSRKLQQELAVRSFFTSILFDRNETSATATSDWTLPVRKQEADGDASDHNYGSRTDSRVLAQSDLADFREFPRITEEEPSRAEDIFQEHPWELDLSVSVSPTGLSAEADISDFPDLPPDERNVVFSPEEVMGDGLWEPAAARNDFSDGLWYEDPVEYPIEEFLPPCHEEAEFPDQLTRTERARQIAMQVAEDYEWDRPGIRLLTVLFERYSWSAAQTAIRRVLEAGTTAQELALAEELRQIWYQRCEFWTAATSGGVLVQKYSTLSWPSSLAIVRSFQGYPQPEEMEAVLNSCLEDWSRSVILQRRYPAFFSYVLYRCGAYGDMEEYDGWVTFSAEVTDDDIFDSPDLVRELTHQGIQLSTRWRPQSRRFQQTDSARQPLARASLVVDDNEGEDEGELC